MKENYWLFLCWLQSELRAVSGWEGRDALLVTSVHSRAEGLVSGLGNGPSRLPHSNSYSRQKMVSKPLKHNTYMLCNIKLIKIKYIKKKQSLAGSPGLEVLLREKVFNMTKTFYLHQPCKVIPLSLWRRTKATWTLPETIRCVQDER